MSTPYPYSPPKLPRTRPLQLERLEDRTQMAADADLANVKSGPLAMAGKAAIELVDEYQAWQQTSTESGAPFASSFADRFRIEGDRVEIEVLVNGDFKTARRELRLAGVTLETGVATFNIFTGMARIDSLETIAQLSQVESFGPLNQGYVTSAIHDDDGGDSTGAGDFITNVGTVQNQARAGMNVPALVDKYKVTGKGVKIGVLSDSISKVGGGLKASQRSGNLGPVQVIQEGNAGSLDEGRAMLELVHDIAPGSPLAFATALFGTTTFARNIDRLRKAGCDVLVDDFTYFEQPMFQPGVVDQAIKRAVDANIPFFSSAGNSNRGGYEVNVGPASFFNGSLQFAAGDVFLSTNFERDTTLVLQWDNAYNGVRNTNAITADIDIHVFDAQGILRKSGDDNNFQTGKPLEIIDVKAGPHNIQIKLDSGQAPTRIKFQTFRGNTTYEYGPNQGVLNSSTYGHNAGFWTIGVGAVPFYEALPFSNQLPIRTEDFTSTGPATYLYDGVQQNRRLNFPLALPQPFISGVDNVNNTFFGGDIPQDSDRLPNFDGTSAAAPNTAGVAALMRQKFPSATPDQIAKAMADSARPVNGQARETWNDRGGFGLVNALAATDALAKMLPGGNVADDGGPNFLVAGAGWQKVSSNAGTYGGDFGFHAATTFPTSENVQYYFNFLKKGTYDVLAHWVPSADRTAQAQYDVYDGDLFEGSNFLNQTRKPVTSAFGGVAWQRVDRIVVTQSMVIVQLFASQFGSVSADAVRLKFIGPSTAGGNAGNASGAPPVDAPRNPGLGGYTPFASSNSAAQTAQYNASTAGGNAAADAALLMWLAGEDDDET